MLFSVLGSGYQKVVDRFPDSRGLFSLVFSARREIVEFFLPFLQFVSVKEETALYF